MQSAFGTVLWVVCGFALIAAFFSLAGSGKTWDEYGKSRLLMESEMGTQRGHAAAPVSTAERDDEIRQMLEAQNARRSRRGERPLDIEAELQRLVTPAVDDELRSEIRELVIARNYRRMRAGQDPLDVDAEVARQVAALHS